MVVAILVGGLFLLTSVMTLVVMSKLLGGRHRKRRPPAPINFIGMCGLWEVSVAAVIAAMPHQNDWAAAIGPGMVGVFMIAGWWLRRFGFLRHF